MTTICKTKNDLCLTRIVATTIIAAYGLSAGVLLFVYLAH